MSTTATRPDIWIRTRTGERVSLCDPQPERLHLEDIAYGLARQFRFVGHADYTVIGHLWLMLTVLERHGCATGEATHMRNALFHDAAEAYIGNLSRPLKRLCPELRVVEGKILDAVDRRFGVQTRSEFVKLLDNAVLRWEMRQLGFRDEETGCEQAESRFDREVAGLLDQADPSRGRRLPELMGTIGEEWFLAAAGRYTHCLVDVEMKQIPEWARLEGM